MGKNILIIDDDKAFTESIAGALRAGGYGVRCENGGCKGLEAARTARPDLVLLEVMADCEGIALAKRLHEDSATRAIPVILVTGIRGAKTLPFSLQADESWLPVRRVLDKPVKPETLLAAISDVLSLT